MSIKQPYLDSDNPSKGEFESPDASLGTVKDSIHATSAKPQGEIMAIPIGTHY